MKLKDLLKEEQFKISNFTLLNKSVYATMEGSIGFTVKINGVLAKGWLRPFMKYTPKGVDINELEVNGKRIKITTGGGGYRTYAIAIWDFPLKSKQPKNLSFTGHYYETSHLGAEFKKELIKIVEKHPELLTDEFKETFGIKK